MILSIMTAFLFVKNSPEKCFMILHQSKKQGRMLYYFNNLHTPNYSMFKTKTHHAYIIMIINKSLV